MRITYIFDDQEDAESFKVFQGAHGMHAAIWNFDQELRGVVKHGDGGPEADFAERWRARLRELMDDEGVALD